MKALPATDESGQDTRGRSLCESGCGKVFTASVITPVWLNSKQSNDKTDTDIITIAVEHHLAGLTTGFPCHLQRFHGEPAVRRERHGPAHWFSCEQVENNGEVRPALTRPE